MIKELSSIAWNVTEPEYRADTALSYSTLAKYERDGYDRLDNLFDKVESPALTQGSMVDTLITGSQEEFNETFYVADFPTIGEKELQIVNYLFDNFHETCIGFSVIPYNEILAAANYFEFQKNWREDTRVKVLTERCSVYYSLKYNAGDRTIVDRNTYEKVLAMVATLKESPNTARYFAPDVDLPYSTIKRYYQLKFKANFEDVNYRCMADLIIQDDANKVITPCDLKTSGKKEWHFEDSFEQWQYMIQARLYWRIIRANMDNDPIFKDYELADYRFIVINKDSLTPLVWVFPLTKEYGTLIDDKGNEFRDPFEIGKELKMYLQLRPDVPKNIVKEGLNIINCLKLKTA